MDSMKRVEDLDQKKFGNHYSLFILTRPEFVEPSILIGYALEADWLDSTPGLESGQSALFILLRTKLIGRVQIRESNPGQRILAWLK